MAENWWGKRPVHTFHFPKSMQDIVQSIGLVPLSIGSWRRAMSLVAWHKEGTGLLVSLPLSVRYTRWSLETTDDHSPFSSHENVW